MKSQNIRVREKRVQNLRHTDRVRRTFLLVGYLKEFRTCKEIAQRLDITKQTVYPYLSLLESLGLDIEAWHSTPMRYRVKGVEKMFCLESQENKSTNELSSNG